MKKGSILLFLISLMILFTSCANENMSTLQPITESQESPKASSEFRPENSYSNVGLRFGQYTPETSYNGYKYEVIHERQNNKYISILYRYKEENNKEELYNFDSSGQDITGVFANNCLYYIQDNDDYNHPTSFKKLNLETLMVEVLESNNNYINGIFQYNNYIFLPCCHNIISFDLITGAKEVVVSSSMLDGYEDMRSSNVFACNDKLWIIRRFTNKEDNKVYCSNLDGSNLSYAGFVVPNFCEIKSVNEKTSELKYYTNDYLKVKNDSEIKTILLKKQ